MWAFVAGIGFDNFYGKRDYLENELNGNTSAYADLGHPGYPNEAGMAYINLVKGEFMTNQTIRNIPNQEEKKYQRHFAYGTYEVTLRDADGNILNQTYQQVTKSPECDHYNKVMAIESNNDLKTISKVNYFNY